jgi:predicted PurR-regulated permease PerM
VVSPVGTLAHVLIGLGLTLFLVSYFLKDGDRFLQWLRNVLPMSAAAVEDLSTVLDQMTWAVLAGHIFVAILQGVLAGLGLLATDLPHPVFWSVVMIVRSLLPIIDSFLIWGPAVLWLLVSGEPLGAAGLAGYGTIVVGISDDYLRPIDVDRDAEISLAVCILGVLGGISAIGFMGLFVGPIVSGALRAALDV